MSYKLVIVRTQIGDSPTTHYDRNKVDDAGGGRIPIGIQLQNQTSRRVRELDATYVMTPGARGIRLAPTEEAPRALVDIHEDEVILRVPGRLAAIDPDTAFASLWSLIDAFPERNGFEVEDPQLGRKLNRYTDREAVETSYKRWASEHARAAPDGSGKGGWLRRLIGRPA